MYPLIGLDPADVREAFLLRSKRPTYDEWAVGFSAVADRLHDAGGKRSRSTDVAKGKVCCTSKAWRLYSFGRWPVPASPGKQARVCEGAGSISRPREIDGSSSRSGAPFRLKVRRSSVICGCRKNAKGPVSAGDCDQRTRMPRCAGMGIHRTEGEVGLSLRKRFMPRAKKRIVPALLPGRHAMNIDGPWGEKNRRSAHRKGAGEGFLPTSTSLKLDGRGGSRAHGRENPHRICLDEIEASKKNALGKINLCHWEFPSSAERTAQLLAQHFGSMNKIAHAFRKRS